MKCPYCGYKESKVIDSRPAEEGSSIRRRRECLSCAKRFTTYETVESLPMVVIKKDGSRQSFDKRKVLNGMIRACEKRPVPFEVLEQKADAAELSRARGQHRVHRRARYGQAARRGRGGLRALCLGLPPVQGHRHVYEGTQQAARGQVSYKMF